VVGQEIVPVDGATDQGEAEAEAQADPEPEADPAAQEVVVEQDGDV